MKHPGGTSSVVADLYHRMQLMPEYLLRCANGQFYRYVFPKSWTEVHQIARLATGPLLTPLERPYAF